MNIIFICGSIEPGKDGVGDYTRRLAGEMIRQGHKASILSINDKYVTFSSEEIQDDSGTKIQTLRLPSNKDYSSKINSSNEFVELIQPDWISLQYVAFSFHPKGLHFGLAGMLSKIGKGRKWHIMFHEIWVGINIESSFKIKIWGILQKYISIKSIKKLKPLICETNTQLYQFLLKKIGFDTRITPIPSTINLKSKFKDYFKDNNRKVVFALFGNINFGAPVEDFINFIQSDPKFNYKEKIEFVFFGASGIYLSEWTFALGIKKIEYRVNGFCSEVDIDNLLSSCDYGISTTPYILSGKSTVIATYVEFGIPVLCVTRNWNVKGFNSRELNSPYNISEFDTEKKKLIDYNETPRSNNYSTFKGSANSLLETLKSFT